MLTKTIQIRRSAEPIKVIQHHVHETRDASTQALPLVPSYFARDLAHRDYRTCTTCAHFLSHRPSQVQSSDAEIDYSIEKEAVALVPQVCIFTRSHRSALLAAF